MADIILNNLSKEFDDFVAVKNVNFTIKDGEFFVLLGASGCGKTTTLRMIAGLELPTRGSILLDNEDVTLLRASQRDIAFIFQFFALYPHLNVEKNIGFPLKIQGLSKKEIRNKVHEVAQLLHLEHLLPLKVSGLSGGDRQRVALGRSIIRRPKAFLMDEPLGALDAEFREKMCLELRKLHDDIVATTVYVTHDQMEAMAMADRVGIMDKGVLLQADTPLTVYNKPRTMYVGNFIGNPAMNFIELHSAIKKGDTSISIDGKSLEVPECYEDSNTDLNYLGIRPEHIQLTDPDKGITQGKVLSVEYLGSHRIIIVETSLGRITVRSGKVNASIDENVGLSFSNHQLVLFHGDTQIAIQSQFIQ